MSYEQVKTNLNSHSPQLKRNVGFGVLIWEASKLNCMRHFIQSPSKK